MRGMKPASKKALDKLWPYERNVELGHAPVPPDSDFAEFGYWDFPPHGSPAEIGFAPA